MPLHGIKLVTFDATNTLLKFRVPPWDYYTTIAREYGFKGNGKHIKSKMLNSYRLMTKQHPNFGKNTISWEQWWRRVIEMTFQEELPVDFNINNVATKLIEDYKTAKCWKKAEGADSLIHTLKETGVSIGVISNFDPRLHTILCNLKIMNWFEFVLTSYEVGFSKPDEKIFEIAKARCKMEIETSQCLHIGDDIEKDYEGARAAGWQALLLTDSHVNSLPVTNNIFSGLKQINDAIEKNDLNFY